jgi:hypothetical protein
VIICCLSTNKITLCGDYASLFYYHREFFRIEDTDDEIERKKALYAVGHEPVGSPRETDCGVQEAERKVLVRLGIKIMQNEIIDGKTEKTHESPQHEVRLGMFDEPLHMLLDLLDETVQIVLYKLPLDHGGW